MSDNIIKGFDASFDQENKEPDIEAGNVDSLQKSDSNKFFVSVNDIQNRVCYFSLAGDQAINAFAKSKNIKRIIDDPILEKEVTKRLFFAIIMFDVVIIHCSDPLRSPLVKSILEKHVEWIENGRIRFIANEDIKDWKEDFDAYITRKSGQYKDGYYATLEAKSLAQPFMTREYKNSVKGLLSKSSYYIRKDDTRSSQFAMLLREDIKHKNEFLFVNIESEEDNSFDNIKKYAIEKTVYQLLNAKFYENETNQYKNIFDKSEVKLVFKGVRHALENRQVVARPAIVEAIKEKISDLNELQEVILDAVTLRMDLMYCRMNAGKHLILEFHPSYEEQTLYRITCFDILLGKLCGGLSLDKMDSNKVNALIENKEVLGEFRKLFLASMADTHEQSSFIIKEWAITTVFKDRLKRMLTTCDQNMLNKISAVLR